MGHLSNERSNVLRTQYPYIFVKKLNVCNTCHCIKQKKLSFALSKSATVKSFELLHMDILGPCSIISMRGFKYFMTIVDDFSHYTWVILLHTKSKVRNHIKFIANVENQFQTIVQIVITDNGAEFAMKDFISSKGIIHQTTCIETPEQNGIVERKHQHLLNEFVPCFFKLTGSLYFGILLYNMLSSSLIAFPAPFYTTLHPMKNLMESFFISLV